MTVCLVLALLAFAVFSAHELLQTDFGRQKLVRLIEDASSSQGRQLDIESLEGDIFSSMALTGIMVSDSQGPWLKVDRLEYRWNPWGLWQGKLWISEFTLKTVDLLRKPQVQEPEARSNEKSQSPAILPASVVVNHLGAETIRVGEDVLGQEFQFSVNSRMAYMGLSKGLSLNLTLQRTDEIPGKVNLEVSFMPLVKGLVVDLKAEEPPGGILVRAFKVPELPEMSATIKGDGTLDDWKGQFDFHAGPSLGAGGEAAFQTIASEQYALDLTMNARLAPFLPPEIKDAWKDSVDFETRVISEAFQKIKIERLSVSHPAVRLDAGGDVSIDGGEMAWHYTLVAGKDKLFATLAPGFHWKSLKVSGTAEGLTTHPNIDLTLDAEGVKGKDFSASLTNARFQIAPDRPVDQSGMLLAIKGEGVIVEPGLADSALQEIIPRKVTWGIQGNLDLDQRQFNFERLQSSSQIAKVNMKGLLTEWGQQAQVKGNITLPDLSQFSQIAKTKLAGNLKLDLDVESQKSGKAVQANFASLIEKMESGFPEVQALIGDQLAIGGRVSLNPQGVITVQTLDFKGQAVSGELKASLTQEQKVDADWSVVFPSLAALSATVNKNLSGQLHVQGNARGVLPSPTVTAKIEGKNLTVDGASVEKGQIDLTVDNLQASPSGTLAVHAKVDGLEAATSTQFALKPDDRLALKNIKVAGLGTEIIGDLLVNLKSLSAVGTLNGRILDYAAINNLAEQEISGNTTFKVDLSADNEQTVKFLTTVDDFNLKGESPVAIKYVALSGKVTHALKEPVIESQLQISGVTHQAATVEKMVLTVEGSVNKVDFKLTADAAPTEGPNGNVKASGRLNLEGPAQELQLTTMAGNVGQFPFQMTEPALLKVAGQNIELNKLALNIKDGSVSSSFKKNASGIFGDFTVEHFPLDMVNQLVPGFGVKGNFHGKAVLDGNFENPKGQLKFSVADLTVDQASTKGLPPATVNLQGDWKAGQSKINIVLNQPSVGELKVNGEIPLRMAKDPIGFIVPDKASIKANAEGQVGLDILNDILVASGSQVGGKVDLAVKVDGTVDDPQVAGTVKYQDGSYENLKLGTSLTAIEVLTTFDRNQVKLEKLIARTPKEGLISGSGTVKRSGEKDFIADLKLSTKSAQLVAIDTVTAQVTSDLHLTGPVNAASVIGEVKIDRADIYVPNHMPASVVVLEVEETNGQETEGTIRIESETGKKEAPKMDLGLNVKIKAPDQVFVRGRGLDVELIGDLLVTGSIAKPKVDGFLKLRRGGLELLSRKVKFKQGVVGFDGVPEREPVLNFQAEVPSKNMTILVAVLGSVSNPRFQLSADPEMPQDEILSNFLFDKSAGSITPIEAVQLANSAAKLAGLGGQGPGLMDTVRGSLGLDTLKFSEGDSGPGVEAGRYVAEGVYLGVKQGLGEDSSGAVLEYEVTPNITVESDIGADANSRVGVSMEWDY